jgi:UDP-glucose 4-epimerase
MNNKIILISGGLGYLGGRIAKHLISLGFQVRIGTSRVQPNVPDDLFPCEIFQYDLSNHVSLEKACDSVTCIIHLASLNAQECNESPDSALLINGFGTLNLLNAAIRMNVNKFVYFSTSHVYGLPLAGKIDEKYTPRPIHDYSITHRLAEDYVLKESLSGNIEGTVFRLTNAVGSPISKGVNCWTLVTNDLCKQAVLNRKIELYSDKFTQRDFVAITDVCSIVSMLLSSSVMNGEIVNISSGLSLTLEELANIIVDKSNELFGFKPSVFFTGGLNYDNSERLEISNKKLKSFGCSINVDLSNEIINLLLNCHKWFGSNDNK